MVKIIVDGEQLVFAMPGWQEDLKKRLAFPLDHIAGARADSFLARNWIGRLRFMAAYVPGMMRPGALYDDGDCVYWEVHNPEKTIIVYLEDEPYAKVVVEVEDPVAAASLIEEALTQGSSRQ
jgi:hypothetical protein